jgi:hypothetical protein
MMATELLQTHILIQFGLGMPGFCTNCGTRFAGQTPPTTSENRELDIIAFQETLLSVYIVCVLFLVPV